MAAAGLLAPFAVGAVESLGLDSIGTLGGQVLSGVLGAGAVGLGYKAGKFVYSDLKRGYQNLVHHHGPDPYMGSKRQRTDDMNNGMDDLPVLGGDTTNRNRLTQKRKLRSGRVGRKLDKETAEFVQRWQRIYHYGSDSNAYPAGVNEENNSGCTNAYSWPTLPAPTNVVNGRLVLSHVLSNYDFNVLPGYLIDLTSWNNTTNSYVPVPVKRLLLGTTSGNFAFQPIGQNFNDPTFRTIDTSWGPESGPSGTGSPNTQDAKALLSWSDIRLCFYGAKNFCTKVTIQFVQFKDSKYLMDFHPDGNSVASMSQLERNEVNGFWLNEFKKLTFNPLDVQMFNRNKALTVLHSESFCINSENFNDRDTAPVAIVKQYFKRFNRLVNWTWNRPNTTVTGATMLENPDFQQFDQGQILGYADPKARIFLYIRAEDFVNVAGGDLLSGAPDREVSFDMVLRNKWRVQL